MVREHRDHSQSGTGNGGKQAACVTSQCALRLSCTRTQVGTVWVNCWLVRDLNVPFGGTKMSGVGREGLKDSFEFYTEVKTICIKH